MGRKLHIGGMIRADGWEVLNAIPGPNVDHLGNANDLSNFSDGVFSEIYASHIVEHLDYKSELQETLNEWNRVLTAGGKLYVSVPDLEILARMFLAKDQLTGPERFHVMRMMFGGHEDEYDYHVVGLDLEFLRNYLHYANFIKIQRVDDFGLFDDTSSMKYKGVPISLNMICEKP